MKVGFTGTRDGCTREQVQQVSYLFSDLSGREFHHGCCVGADEDAMYVILEQYPEALVVGHPPDEDALLSIHAPHECHLVFKRRPYLERNRAIVNATDVLFACPKGPEELRSGTWATIRFARKQGKSVIIIWPNGTVNRENSNG